jgi:2-oxoglutarate ferredoxin oxidoreductase subunit delta
VSVCPVKLIELDKSTVNAIGYNPAYPAYPDKCIACTNCAIMCPDTVITVERLDG